MEFIDLQKPILVSIDQLKKFLKNDRTQIDPSVEEIYFPHIQTLSWQIRIDELITPWNSDLDGLRISVFNNTTPRILKRSNKTVSWSKIIDGETYNLIIQEFTNKTAKHMRNIRNLSGTTQPAIYSSSTCIRLFKSTFLDRIKPRLIPPIHFPDTKDCIDIMKQVFPTTWEESDFNGTRRLKIIDNKYVFEVLGERGDQQFMFSSPQLEETQWTAFKYLTGFEYSQNDSNFIFNDFYLPS